MPKSGTAWKLYKYELPIEDLLAEWIASGLVVREGEGVYRATQRGLDLAPAAAGLSDR